MTYTEAVAELRVKHPGAGLSPSAVAGERRFRAAGIDFRRGRDGMYVGRAGGTEVLVYFNDTERLICCTEMDRDAADDDE